MGQEILYCFKCQDRVTSADLDSANALRFGNRVACKKCVPDLIATLSPKEQKDLVARVQAPAARERRLPTPRSIPRAAPRSNTAVWGMVVGGGAAVLIVLLIVVFG